MKRGYSYHLKRPEEIEHNTSYHLKRETRLRRNVVALPDLGLCRRRSSLIASILAIRRLSSRFFSAAKMASKCHCLTAGYFQGVLVTAGDISYQGTTEAWAVSCLLCYYTAVLGPDTRAGLPPPSSLPA